MNMIEIIYIQDGKISQDGGIIFSNVGRGNWIQMLKPDRNNKVKLNNTAVLVKIQDRYVLLNTGLGENEDNQNFNIYGRKNSKAIPEIKRRVKCSEITDVIFTSPHEYFTGGATLMDNTGEIKPTFKNATYYMHERAWAEFHKMSPIKRAKYNLCHGRNFEALKVLYNTGKLKLISENEFWLIQNIIKLERTDGIIEGNMIAKINQGSEKYLYFGALVPSKYHLYNNIFTAQHRDHELSEIAYQRYLKESIDKGYKVIFAQSFSDTATYLEGNFEKRFIGN